MFATMQGKVQRKKTVGFSIVTKLRQMRGLLKKRFKERVVERNFLNYYR